MFSTRMDAPDTPPQVPAPAPSRRVTRRGLFKLAGAGVALAATAEAARVLFGSNEHTVIPGKVYRSAQLKQQKLERVIAEKHIRTVMNLRGCCPHMDWYQADARATHARQICQEDLTFSAKRYPPAPEIVRLVEVFDRAEYPVLIHCARGSDRTGLACGMAVLLLTDGGIDAARRQLHPRYGHVAAVGRTGVLDEFFDAYEAKLAATGEAHTPDRFRKWATTEYCPGPFRAGLSVVGPTAVPVGVGFAITVRAKNLSEQPWTFSTGGSGGVHLTYSLHDSRGALAYRGKAGFLARTVAPGEFLDLAAGFPPVKPGKYTLNADLIDAQPIDLLDTAFAQYGSEALMATLTAA
ncbi:protein tyrosine serine phosphatase : Uncharacterized protein OS=Thermodesulfovibrio yellowstonii (strain ATCC 51303 / DSM 11347 / YP87) GN=THEYE_A0750 PE=4 SV=1: Y_phosphatase3 [Gemmataceae bacterium]|nr:protein tyrosine serine phosphatase : Uncharacterized protein OS=Thermodesulfovibrio yellowstonii (strain ATCC 51303 / DSM 11347 / YP87) GN=THEYE_A0750 PE=4 SV=1: Y_phosphatase3 [Gemmataceae bacterium]VTT97467.1 protein tyrosine serine phosphatase : Uncharacterized protein OS=Thermodesulfovibrio yellowstonii (strain ATCC 51303 / DSM 11347 / YP87) GN=THEYE_A0750 PE=4 SV=1: Y_phosphatase3 [Gemmataceae bacterium]